MRILKFSPVRITFLSALCWAGLSATSLAALDARIAGLKGDGVTDDTAALQQAVGQGSVEIVFPPGIYLLGMVNIPSHVTLRGEPGAKIRINPETLNTYDGEKATKQNLRCVFALKGSDIALKNLEFDFTLTDADTVRPDQRPGVIIRAVDQRNLLLSGLVANRPQPIEPIPVAERRTSGVGQARFSAKETPANKTSFHLSLFERCHDIVMRDCRAAFMYCLMDLVECTRIWALNNAAVDCYSITRCKSGNEFLYHMGNWSRNVTHQCRWFGGNANDHRNMKAGDPGWDTAPIVKRGSKRSDPGFNKFTQGEFDIIVANNYAEYGQSLSWGSKGRQIIFQGNIGRFMTDYALGSEGGEEVVFDGNIVINSYTAGLVAMYWSEKLVLKGNIVMVKDEPIDMQYSTYSTPAPYQGSLIRLHAAGGAHKSGAGQILITGNLLVNELADRPRRIGIESGRDVQITANKIRNGAIRTKNGSGRLLIENNDFEMTIPHSSSWIYLAAGLDEGVARNNTFRNSRPLESRSPTEFLICAEADRGKATTGKLRVIERNLIQGFPLAIWGRAMSKVGQDRFLIRNNTVEGEIRMEGVPSAYRGLFDGNINGLEMKPLEAKIIPLPPQALPEPVAAPEDKADAESDGTATAPASEE